MGAEVSDRFFRQEEESYGQDILPLQPAAIA